MNILVTGGSSGLGKAIVNNLANDPDNKILFTYCNNKDAANAIVEAYTNVEAIRVDYKDKKSIDEFIDSLNNREVDVLINNAYTGNPQGIQFHRTKPQDFLDAFEYNILPLIKITQSCLVGMRKRKYGKIINIITSFVMDAPPAGFSVYTTTKAYIRQLSKSIGKEYAQFNITSNCVLPEYMHTGFGDVQDYQLEQLTNAHPLRKLLQPDDVAGIVNAILHSSQQLNGVEIPVNAGQHMI